MTAFARGGWCGRFGAKGESEDSRLSIADCGLDADCEFVASRWVKASEPSPPAEARRNERRLMEKSESVHIKKRVAGQQHLAKVGPDSEIRARLTLVDGVLFIHEFFGSGNFVVGRRT